MISTLGLPVSPAATGPPLGIALNGDASSANSATSPSRGARSRLRRGGVAGGFDVRWKGRKTSAGYRVTRIRAREGMCRLPLRLLFAAVRGVPGVDHAHVGRRAAVRLVVRIDVVARLERVVPVVPEEVVVSLTAGHPVVLVASLDPTGGHEVLALAAALAGLVRSAVAERQLVVGSSLE